MAVIVMAITIGTVGSIVQSCSASFSRDIVEVFNKNISDKSNIMAARIFVFVFTLAATLWAIYGAGISSNITIVFAVYQAVVQIFPAVLLGMFWRKADKLGAVLSFTTGTALSIYWMIYPPAFAASTGWSGGMVALVIAFIIMIVFGLLNKDTSRADRMFTEFAVIKAKSRQRNTAKSKG
jgi:Na+/proline symporter